MAEALTEAEEEQAKISEDCSVNPLAYLAPEELVAKAVAPVKKEFIHTPPLRHSSSNGRDQVSDPKTTSNVVKDKKSKRQLKRERQQEQKSTVNICPEVAKTGNTSACLYNGNCRFSHDLEAFLAQKPADLPGLCPFICKEEQCLYGMACRFAGTHKNCVATKTLDLQNKSSEKNALNKVVQKLLWKNKMSFPKADAQLKYLGLLGKGNLKIKKVNEEESSKAITNGSNVHEGGNEIDCSPTAGMAGALLHNTIANDDCQPLKKTKLDENGCLDQTTADQMGHNLNSKSSIETELNHSCTPSISNDIMTDESPEVDFCLKENIREKKLIDFRGKMYLAPLTTVGNLPFRRVCKVLGADITCGEMAMCTNLLQGQASEWALLRRHSSEDLFGVQICGAHPDIVARAVDLIDQECTVDFIDINMGCPIDIVVNKGAGSSLLMKPMRMKNIIAAASGTTDKLVTVKVRTGYFEGRNRIDSVITDISRWGANAVTIHGRSRQQRYSKLADWDYIYECAKKAPDVLQVLGNGDVFSYSDWNKHAIDCPKLSACMIARGALIKPWIFTEIKEQRDWDISSGERLNILKDFVHFGLEHWGSDTKGVERTRYFMLEWLSYTYRYIPVALLDIVPQRLNWRPPSYFGRNDLETLMASDSAADWIRISEMLLGPVPAGFTFAPKHKSNAYHRAENG